MEKATMRWPKRISISAVVLLSAATYSQVHISPSFSPYVAIEFSAFRLGYSYDINTSAF